MAPLKILIVGCGIAGPTLATFLLLSDLPAPQKPHVTILERAPSLRPQGQNIDIRGAGVTIIRKLGLETIIRASTTGEEGVQHVDASGYVWGAIGADKTGRKQTPTSDIEILRGRLAMICFERSRMVSEEVRSEGGGGIEYVWGDTLDELDQDGGKVRVRFAKSEKRRSFDVVVGADGLQSGTRGLVWGREGEKDRVRRLDMYAGYFSIPRAETDSQWRRWFHALGSRSIMLRPDGTGQRTTASVSVVNKDDPRLAEAIGDGPQAVEKQKRLLEGYFKGVGWESDRVLKEMWETSDFYYDMVGQVKMDQWYKGRVVLLADAGYCAAPLSGMGTTLALDGAYNLAGALLQHPNDHTAAFVQYQQKMRPVVDRAQKLFPGAPYTLWPQTAWGLAALFYFTYIISASRIGNLLFMFAGPPANEVPVEEYGFKQLPEKLPDSK